MSKITSSSTAEYFAKNLQQVGFSSPAKAVLTTLKEAVDNSLDACEEAGILPEISIEIGKLGPGASRNTDLVQIVVEDNGPGLDPDDLGKVFGEYLASSKFGRGRCSRGQQGIGISAATTWAQLTNASGVRVISKTKNMRKAVSAIIDVDIKGNRGIIKKKETIDWDKSHGLKVEFRIDGRVVLNGDGGLLTYLEGTTLVNPHMSINYKLVDQDPQDIPRVATTVPDIPPATLPHPHTMKLGEFMTHAGLYGKIALENFLKKGFSRVNDATVKDMVKKGLAKGLMAKNLTAISEEEYKKIYQALHDTELIAPSTRSVLTVGEEGLSKSIQRLGEVDFFSVVTRKPRICDFKPVVVEVAIARFKDRGSDEDAPVQLLRFANRVPLQFDKGACAITRSVESVNWRSYGLNQPKDSVPTGPYVFAVSVTSPFIKFKNASKETIDGSDDLVDEIRRALMQAGQKLSRHIRAEYKAADLERKISHIEKFGPILVEGLARIVSAPKSRVEKAEEGLKKLLGRDASSAEAELEQATSKLKALKDRERKKLGGDDEEAAGDAMSEEAVIEHEEQAASADDEGATKGSKKSAGRKKK
ncbi:MAG: DNA topoisomerase VI subunit B [Bdellovibrionales bacterium]|nr:DNA topoisomerase VI subunit B [Bdellovibrionales bacterium]